MPRWRAGRDRSAVRPSTTTVAVGPEPQQQPLEPGPLADPQARPGAGRRRAPRPPSTGYCSAHPARPSGARSSTTTGSSGRGSEHRRRRGGSARRLERRRRARAAAGSGRPGTAARRRPGGSSPATYHWPWPAEDPPRVDDPRACARRGRRSSSRSRPGGRSRAAVPAARRARSGGPAPSSTSTASSRLDAEHGGQLGQRPGQRAARDRRPGATSTAAPAATRARPSAGVRRSGRRKTSA